MLQRFEDTVGSVLQIIQAELHTSHVCISVQLNKKRQKNVLPPFNPYCLIFYIFLNDFVSLNYSEKYGDDGDDQKNVNDASDIKGNKSNSPKDKQNSRDCVK
jgi:hypothetical protein